MRQSLIQFWVIILDLMKEELHIFFLHWLYLRYLEHCCCKYYYVTTCIPFNQLITCRLFLQQIKLSSRIVAIIGLIMSIASCALLADWQSIGNDKCTTFSGYHHSNLTKYHNSTIIQEVLTSPMEIKDVQIDIDANLKLDGKIVLPYLLKRTMTCAATNDVHNICRRSLAECIIVEKYASAITSDLHRCPCNTLPHIEHVKAFKCGKEELLDIFLCLYVNTTYYNSRSRQLNPNEAYIESQSSKNLMTKCKEAKFEGHSCYWIPQSIVTKTYCEDCSPICRNLYQSLNFIQFCFGCALLMLAIPVAWVPVASIVSDKVDSETQVSIHSYKSQIHEVCCFKKYYINREL